LKHPRADSRRDYYRRRYTSEDVVKKVLWLSTLLAVVWGLAMTGWSVAAHLTGAPGPAHAANAMFDVSEAALASVDLPRPLSGPRRLALRQLDASRRIVASVLRGPERVGAAISDHWSKHLHRLRVRASPRQAPGQALTLGDEHLGNDAGDRPRG
jgi:hypothetical protein